MKTILYLHAGAEMYGADKILLELTTGLDKNEFRPIVILPNNGILKEKLEDEGIETYVIPYPILRRKYMNIKGLVSYLMSYRKESDEIINLLRRKNIKVDIVHVNTLAVLEGIRLKKKMNIKLVWHVHEIILSPKIVAKFLSYCVGRYADMIVTVSDAVSKNLIASNVVPLYKLRTIYNGIDSKKFSPNVKCDYLFNEWNIPQNAMKIGMIGRINNWKGQNDFLDATAPLLSKYPNLYIFIVGGAFEGQEWRINKLKQRISQLENNDRIVFSNFRNDNFAVENFFDILVLPSINPDPLPTVVLEAMGCGKAIVGYGHGGITEMVKDGYNGFLAEPNSVKDLQDKIEDCIKDNNYKKMGLDSRIRQVKCFSINSFISNFEKLYMLVSKQKKN